MIGLQNYQRRSANLVILPMKAPSISKTRLKHILLPSERCALARLLFDRSLNRLIVLRDVGVDIDIVVVTQSFEIASHAMDRGVHVLSEPDPSDLTAAVTHAANWAADMGYRGICILPADLTDPDLSEMQRLFEEGARQEGVIVCPSRDLGTNALYVSPPDLMRFAYGARSAVRHLETAEASGVRAVLWPLASLRDDIDTIDCLERAFESVPELRACLKSS